MKHIKRLNSNAWTKKDIAYLTDNYGVMTSCAMAIQLNRTMTSVESQLYKMRKAGVLVGTARELRAKPVSSTQMVINKDAVMSETLFLVGYGDYPMFYKRLVRDGLAKSMKEKNTKWFWDRRDWILSRWLDFFASI